MKRKSVMIVLTGALLLGLSACGTADTDDSTAGNDNVTETTADADQTADDEENVEEPDTTDTEESSEESDETEDDETEYEGDATTSYVKIYAPVLDKYYQALTEQWDAEKLEDEQMSVSVMEFYGDGGMDTLAYGFLDLDGDGYWELVIGVNDPDDQDLSIFDGYTYKDDKITQIFSGAYRNIYYIEEDEAAGYLIDNEASNGAANSAWISYVLDGERLSAVQSIVYDAMADEEHPWFMGSDDDWDTSNDEPIDEKMATDIMDSARSRYIKPDYLSFQYYK